MKRRPPNLKQRASDVLALAILKGRQAGRLCADLAADHAVSREYVTTATLRVMRDDAATGDMTCEEIDTFYPWAKR